MSAQIPKAICLASEKNCKELASWSRIIEARLLEDKVRQVDAGIMGFQSLKAFQAYCKDFDFYSEWNRKSLEGLQQRSDMISGLFKSVEDRSSEK